MPGYFPADSVAVHVMSNRAVGLTYGQRALIIGAVHPQLFAGTVQHTEHRRAPYSRLMLTARLFETVFLGTKTEADRALEFTRRKHEDVRGTLRESAGPHFPAGTPYSALDPQLMYMTLAFTVDSVETMHDLLVRRLRADERERLWQDFVRWAELFGMPREAAPAGYAQFRREFNAYLGSDRLHLLDEARVVGSYLAGAKRAEYTAPIPLRPVFRTMSLFVRASLPTRIRELYGFDWTTADEAAFRAALLGVRGLYAAPRALVPPPLRRIGYGANRGFFQMIAQAEQRHLRQGLLSMPELVAMSRCGSAS